MDRRDRPPGADPFMYGSQTAPVYLYDLHVLKEGATDLPPERFDAIVTDLFGQLRVCRAMGFVGDAHFRFVDFGTEWAFKLAVDRH